MNKNEVFLKNNHVRKNSTVLVTFKILCRMYNIYTLNEINSHVNVNVSHVSCLSKPIDK